MTGDETAREVHPLLLAAGECRRREIVQPARNVEAQQQVRRLGARGVGCGPACDRGFRDEMERADARHHAQELADIAERLAAHREDRARVGLRDVHHRAAMADQDAPAVRPVVAVEGPHQRRLAGAGRAGQRDALSCVDFERDAFQHRDVNATLEVQREALVERVRAQHQPAHSTFMAGLGRPSTSSCDASEPGRPGQRPGHEDIVAAGGTDATSHRLVHPVGGEADPVCTDDPPLTHWRPEGARKAPSGSPVPHFKPRRNDRGHSCQSHAAARSIKRPCQRFLHAGWGIIAMRRARTTGHPARPIRHRRRGRDRCQFASRCPSGGGRGGSRYKSRSAPDPTGGRRVAAKYHPPVPGYHSSRLGATIATARLMPGAPN